MGNNSSNTTMSNSNTTSNSDRCIKDDIYQSISSSSFTSTHVSSSTTSPMASKRASFARRQQPNATTTHSNNTNTSNSNSSNHGTASRFSYKRLSNRFTRLASTKDMNTSSVDSIPLRRHMDIVENQSNSNTQHQYQQPQEQQQLQQQQQHHGFNVQSRVDANEMNKDNHNKPSRPNNKRLDRYNSNEYQDEDTTMSSTTAATSTINSPTVNSSSKRRLTRLLSCGEKKEHYSEKDVAAVLASILQPQIETNDQAINERTAFLKSQQQSQQAHAGNNKDSNDDDNGSNIVVYNDPFCGTSLPPISLQDYIERIVHYLTSIAHVEKESGRDLHVQSDLAMRYVIVALMYIRRMTYVEDFLICSMNVHRLIITGVTIASKMLDDFQPRNSYFARLGGVTVKELNYFESIFCAMLKFNLGVPVDEFDVFLSTILNELERRSDLIMQSDVVALGSIIKQLDGDVEQKSNNEGKKKNNSCLDTQLQAAAAA